MCPIAVGASLRHADICDFVYYVEYSWRVLAIRQAAAMPAIASAGFVHA